ncbi:hypothetical protein HOF92_04180 [bacterium]|jgi:hypothetical protein|nr:hypothetical protein [bacterium]
MNEELCHVCLSTRTEEVDPQPGISLCRLCENRSCGRHTYSYSTEDSLQILLCQKCLLRYKIPEAKHSAVFLDRFQTAVLGITTVYRCPQCHGEVRFRGFFEKVRLCSACTLLVCNHCGEVEPGGEFLCLNCGSEEEVGQRGDAPPELRCYACHAPVKTDTDSRFNRTYKICSSCSKPMCNFCMPEDPSKSENTCCDCAYQEPKSLWQKLRGLFSHS